MREEGGCYLRRCQWRRERRVVEPRGVARSWQITCSYMLQGSKGKG